MAKLTEKKKKKAFDAFMKSEESKQTPEEKRDNAWFPIHIRSVMKNEDNICYNNGRKTGEGLITAFGFSLSEAWDFEKNLRKFCTGVLDGIQEAEKKLAEAEQKKEAEPSN